MSQRSNKRGWIECTFHLKSSPYTRRLCLDPGLVGSLSAPELLEASCAALAHPCRPPASAATAGQDSRKSRSTKLEGARLQTRRRWEPVHPWPAPALASEAVGRGEGIRRLRGPRGTPLIWPELQQAVRGPAGRSRHRLAT